MRFAAADTMRQTPDEYAPYLTEDLGAYTERASPLAPCSASLLPFARWGFSADHAGHPPPSSLIAPKCHCVQGWSERTSGAGSWSCAR